jgi:hypothetical protein
LDKGYRNENDGEMMLWIDNIQLCNLAGIENDTRRIDRANLESAIGMVN